MVYTPFHGTGYRLIPEVLRRLGMKHVLCVPEQMVIDGNFPTVVSPNPENPEGFYLAIDLAKKNDVDFILGTDPDSDRVGIMVRNKQGEFEPVTGNQTGVLLLDYLIGAMKRAGKLPAHPAALKTIVTTEMARAVAEANGLDCYDTFTGFKFLAEKKDKLEAAGIEIIECGFLTNRPRDEDCSLFAGPEAILPLLPRRKPQSQFVAMIAMGEKELSPDQLLSLIHI